MDAQVAVCALGGRLGSPKPRPRANRRRGDQMTVLLAAAHESAFGTKRTYRIDDGRLNLLGRD